MDGLKPLKPLNPDGNLKSWKCGKSWKQDFIYGSYRI